ncbi:MAG: sigma 54-interacting transcriptional regulator [Deltaproteobacteria bacterium]|jgi:PAS domain S-box-containing protein|nr:sigma 54-interacting transcriptional regulator [Deltaproteobacteria bacterium]MBT7890612.1 sigma 54-interacting transcriptional regulator [Deltaproteobacteria bacterium]
MISVPGYKIIEKIHQDTKNNLYRGRRETDETPVLIRMPSLEYPSSGDLGRLSHEFEITKDLNLRGIQRPYALQKIGGTLAIILEDVGGESLKSFAASRRLSLREFLDIAIPLVETLGELHHKNVIHKNINPANIIINRKTAEVKLTDFSIASVLPQEDPRIISPAVTDEGFAYISPEQTGRMNRILDYRTDFYSLGVTFYEVLTGRLPFQATDALELVHSHMAKRSVPAHEVDPAIPTAISEIVSKLMAKTAEERYLSASGLKADLERCLRMLEETGKIEEFEIGHRDISEKFRIVQGLYGREREIEVLLGLFDQVSHGKTDIAMVSGYAGIGKTSLVKEIYKHITTKKGRFISGKFDQLHWNVPYSALIHAFQELVRELLTERREDLEHWKEELLTVLGPNGQIIIDVISNVELIIGSQPPVVDLGPVESQNRFNLVFRNFIRVFCEKEHPLVIFLDDLQWVDLATLRLIDLLMTDEDMQYFFLIGAYRDNEVDSSHPLAISLESLKENGVSIAQVEVEPLGDQHVTHLIADTLSRDQESVMTLANLVVQKTNGNPFFVNQFLTTLYEEDLLIFEAEEREWQWEMPQIQALDITGNVVELLIKRLERLSSETRHLLRFAACIGNKFDLKTLSLITDKTPADTFHGLLPASQEGIIIPISGSETKDLPDHDDIEGGKSFKFLHDRVQQATYALIEEQEKKKVHLKIGRLLLENAEGEAREESLFDILNHLNPARDLMTLQADRDALVELNLNAGRKAKVSAAYEMAFEYLKMGLGLLDPHSWRDQYELALELHNEATEIACLSGHFEQMEHLVETVIQNASTVQDKVAVYQFRVLGYWAQNKLSEALGAALEILQMLGMKFTKELTLADMRRSVNQTQSVVGRKTAEELLNLPQMRDPVNLAILRIIKDAAFCAYSTRYELFVQLLLAGINLIQRNGNTSLAPFFYCFYGSVLCGVADDIESGYKYGQLGLDLLQRLNAREIMCRTLFAFNVYIRHFKEHVKETFKPLADGYQAGLETGDLSYAAYCALSYCVRMYMASTNLVEVKKEMGIYVDAIRKINQPLVVDVLQMFHQAISNLLNDSEKPWMLIGEVYDERTKLPFHQEANNRFALHYFYFNKLIHTCVFMQYDEAVESADMAERYLDEVTGGLAVPVFHFYDSIARLGAYDSTIEDERKRNLKKVASNQKKMKMWAHHAPMNHLHKYHLVEAEHCRVLGKELEAHDHYDRAIQLAKENEYINEEAYANELAARFWLAKKKDEIAKVYLGKALHLYALWGATRKVRDLEEKYGLLKLETQIEDSTADRLLPKSGTLSLDLSTMMKTSQAISSEIVLDRLLKTFMKIVIENVGAQAGSLILQSDGRLLVKAHCAVDQNEVLLEPFLPVAEADYLSDAIVAYVARTRKHLVLNDAAQEGMFMNDSYVKSRRPRSVLCAPILHKSKLIGALYLENNLISKAFTPERLEVLNVLSSQIAISLENARLFGDLKVAEEKYRSIFENAVEGIYQTTLEGRFMSANPAMARIFGFESPKELLEQTNDIVHQFYVNPDRRQELIALMREHETVSGFEIEFYRKDGSRFWASLYARPVSDDSGNLAFIEGIVADVTDKIRAMEALHEQGEYLRKENIRLRSNIKDRYRFGNLVGKSPAMQKVYELILRAAATDVNAIIYGESGTGKELVARAIHDLSDRKGKRFVSVNCGAIPQNLLESEFFGYKKGAFTGAIRDKGGYLDLADQGTLFLDELGEMDLNIQAKLLRAIEGGGYMPVGGTEERKPNIRIIAATSRDLQDHVKKGLMREDFYYRVHIIPITLTPLRKRREDIPLLIDHFLKISKYEKDLLPLTGRVLEQMMDYDWPGNVRELENTLHRYATLKKLDFLGMSSKEQAVSLTPSVDLSLDPKETSPKLCDFVAGLEKKYIMQLLEQYQWNRSKVASILGISRRYLFTKMRKFGVNQAHNENI